MEPIWEPSVPEIYPNSPKPCRNVSIHIESASNVKSLSWQCRILGMSTATK